MPWRTARGTSAPVHLGKANFQRNRLLSVFRRSLVLQRRHDAPIWLSCAASAAVSSVFYSDPGQASAHVRPILIVVRPGKAHWRKPETDDMERGLRKHLCIPEPYPGLDRGCLDYLLKLLSMPCCREGSLESSSPYANRHVLPPLTHFLYVYGYENQRLSNDGDS